VPDPSGVQLRVDGTLTALSANGLNFDDGGRIAKTSDPNGLEIDFPNGATLFVSREWWADQGKWYFNLDASRAQTGTKGIMASTARRSWLPALPDGSSVGPMPSSLHDRFLDLYQKFADGWRVTDTTSLFDYAPGTSSDTFSMRSWPPENAPCVIPKHLQAKSLAPRIAGKLCRAITDKNMKADCVFDVTVTGDPGFAKLYLLSQRIRASSKPRAPGGDATRKRPK
jgi:hypothetical protein